MSETILTELQQDLAARLSACEYFADIPVLTQRQGDIDSGIEKALGPVAGKGGKAGVCVILLQPTASLTSPNLPVPLLRAEIAVRVLENVALNTSPQGTRKAALSIATAILNCLHHYQPAGLAQALTAESPSIIPVQDSAAALACEARFSAQLADPDVLYKTATPLITPASGSVPLVVALSCDTLGTSLYYARDGDSPYPGMPGAQLYTLPFSVMTPGTVRAVAVKAGQFPSNTVYAKYG